MIKTQSASSGTWPVVSARRDGVRGFVDISAQTHTGHVRTNNEDHYYVARAARTLETMLTSLPAGDVPQRADEINHVMVVADGMGGHAAGEVASRLAISTLVALALDIPDWIFRVDDEHAAEMRRRASEVVQQVGALVFERGCEDSALRGMGSTLTCARSCGRDLWIVHVGDSRAYLLRRGRLERLTKDHTYAQMMVDSGQLEPEEAARSGLQHILTNAIGGTSTQVHVDVDLLHLEDGDRLMLCSDGLTDAVDDETIASTLAADDTTPADVCQRLVQLALDGGGRDNITVIVASFRY
jgi:protein phosphatase